MLECLNNSFLQLPFNLLQLPRFLHNLSEKFIHFHIILLQKHWFNLFALFSFQRLCLLEQFNEICLHCPNILLQQFNLLQRVLLMRSWLIYSLELSLRLKHPSHSAHKIQHEANKEHSIDGIARKNSLNRLKNSDECIPEVFREVGGGVNCYRSQQLHSNNTSTTQGDDLSDPATNYTSWHFLSAQASFWHDVLGELLESGSGFELGDQLGLDGLSLPDVVGSQELHNGEAVLGKDLGELSNDRD